jgi:hypothetical protein
MSTPRFTSIELDGMTFDEFVEYGKANGGNIVDGMPWSFTFDGYSVSHENNDCYIISATSNSRRQRVGIVYQDGKYDSFHSVMFLRGDVLRTSPAGELYIEKLP